MQMLEAFCFTFECDAAYNMTQLLQELDKRLRKIGANMYALAPWLYLDCVIRALCRDLLLTDLALVMLRDCVLVRVVDD